MRCMVKLNHLEDMAEPPLDEAPKASSLAMRENQEMEMEVDAGDEREQLAMHNST